MSAQVEGIFSALHSREKMSVSRDELERLKYTDGEDLIETLEEKEWLEIQEMKQEVLPAEHHCVPTLPTLPPEITNKILSCVPTRNKLAWNGEAVAEVYVVGLLPHAIYNPSLLPPYYHDHDTFIPRRKRTLEDIAKQKMTCSLLGEASLANQIELHVERCSDFSSLRQLSTYPLRWKRIRLNVGDRNENFADLFQLWFSSLQELDVHVFSEIMPGIILPLQKDSRLKVATVSFNIFLRFFNTGVLNLITSLSLYDVNEFLFHDYNALKEVLGELPHILSQLPCLYELRIVEVMELNHHDVAGLPRVKSTSLHSLKFTGEDDNYNDNGDDDRGTIAFLNIFAECRIDYIEISQHLLRGVERLFSNVQHVHARVSPKQFSPSPPS